MNSRSTTLVLGGGAAGFFAAVHRAEHHPEEAIIILERGKSVLEKVRISGGGRCNVTHACWDPRELVAHYPRGGRELLGPFNAFACGDTMGWFGERGVELKIEGDGRVFPVSDSSQTIIDCLRTAAKNRGVRVLTKTRVTAITAPSTGPSTGDPAKNEPKKWTVQAGDRTFRADRLVVTTGSNPAVWRMLAGLGHTLVDPVPSLFSFNTKDVRLRDLAGVSLPWAQLGIPEEKLRAEGPLLITHRGLSGPAVLRLSAWGARLLAPRDYRFELIVNWSAQRLQDVTATLGELRQTEAKRQITTRPHFGLPARLWRALVAAAGLPPDQRWSQLSTAQTAALTDQLTDARFAIAGKSTNKEEFTTAGGVLLKEVDFRDFRSKIHPTLYLAGEVLDVDAITGGFNFQAAWTGGYLIGRAG